jgi:general secretion pathway protein J
LSGARSERGFTLLELLLAMAIMGLVAALMTSGLSFLGKAEARRVERADTVDAALGGLALVRQSLARAQPLFRRERNQSLVLFEGGAERLRFAGREPDFIPGASLMAYELGVGISNGQYALQARRAPMSVVSPTLSVLDQAQARTLLRLPGPARFTYYGVAARNQPPGWREDWLGRAALPIAVRLAEGAGPVWPEILVRLEVDSAPTCPAQSADAPECRL